MTEIRDPDTLDLTRWIKAGDAIVSTQIHGEPLTLTRRLIEQRAQIGPTSIFIGPTIADTFRAEHGDFIQFYSYCGTARNAQLYAGGVLDPVPSPFSEYPRLFETGAMRCDVAFLAVSEHEGRFNLGVGNDYVVQAARRARAVILEVMPGMPWTGGASLPPDIVPHLIVRGRSEPAVMQVPPEGNAQERAIAENVARLIPDDATLALGIGSMANLVLSALKGRRRLGIHSGAIGDAMIDLMESGTITNEHNPVHPGVSVSNVLMGSRSLLDYVHRNPRVRLEPTTFTHDLATMRAIPRLYALSSGVEIDLTGQVNAETVGGRYVGAVGGQGDFVRGANLSPGGGSIMMFASTARRGAVSRIVSRLADAVVTTPRSDVQFVVTEFGVADLRGKSLRQRVQAMLAIAHPDFRDALERGA